jgi:hypothetical protein
MVEIKAGLKQLLPPVLWNALSQITLARHYSGRAKSLVARTADFKGILKNEEIFLIGSGPSTKGQDLGKLVDKNVIFLNNLFTHREYPHVTRGQGFKGVLFAPLHPPQTIEEWQAWLIAMNSQTSEGVHVLAGLSGGPYRANEIIESNGLFQRSQIAYYFAGINTNVSGYRFSPRHLDLTRPIFLAQAASVFGLMWCAWLGARRVYMLGMDHNYLLFEKESEMRIYETALHQTNEFERTFGSTFYEVEYLRQYHIFMQYRLIRDHCDMEIYNCSQSSLCRVFPKMNYDECV